MPIVFRVDPETARESKTSRRHANNRVANRTYVCEFKISLPERAYRDIRIPVANSESGNGRGIVNDRFDVLLKNNRTPCESQLKLIGRATS